MNRRFKKALLEAQETPAPQGKREFLEKIEAKEAGIHEWQFVLSQASYIRKWVWAIFLAVFLAALMCARCREMDMLWRISAFTPFLAISFVTETVRSEIYGMWELEMASRFSLKSVMLARMGILGAAHLFLLCTALLLGRWGDGAAFFRVGVYLLVPYLLTDVGGLWIVRKMRGKEGAYAGIGFAAFVGIFPMAGRYIMDFLYRAEAFGWWVAALLVLGVAAVEEVKKNIDRTEELAWN